MTPAPREVGFRRARPPRPFLVNVLRGFDLPEPMRHVGRGPLHRLLLDALKLGSGLDDLTDCPYYAEGGTCNRGCYSEPSCRTDEPREGWPGRWSLRSKLRQVSPSGVAIALLNRVPEDWLPRDTLYIGGEPYMHRWYVWGYAPTPDDPDAAFTCATCKLDVQQGDESGLWWHVGHGAPIQNQDHAVQPVSAPRSGWRWQDHGVGAFRIHCTVASDAIRAFHDHPWHFASVIVRGAYRELRPARGCTPGGNRWARREGAAWAPAVDDERNDATVYRAPALNVKAAADLHVLEVVDGPVWSLFFTRPKVRSWGFAGPFGWLGWRTFDAEHPERDAFTR